MKNTGPILALMGFLAAGIVILIIVAMSSKDCLASHLETRHRESYSSLTTLTGQPWYGKGTPITRTHPAQDYIVEVCDQYE